jgi:hypothetical protein
MGKGGFPPSSVAWTVPLALRAKRIPSATPPRRGPHQTDDNRDQPVESTRSTGFFMRSSRSAHRLALRAFRVEGIRSTHPVGCRLQPNGYALVACIDALAHVIA